MSGFAQTRRATRERDDDRRRRRARRVRVLLAAGLVLGIGTAVTLAAWTDTENATGSFGASVFGTESQSAGSPTYASNTAAPGASLTFAATAMSPGTSFYAWLNVRTTSASTVGGTVSLTGAAPTGTLAPALEYRAVRLSGPAPGVACSAAAFTGSPVFVAGGASSYLPVTQVPSTPVASTIGAAGAQLGFCFEVRIAAGAANTFQGTTGQVTWTFASTSAS
ncbi:SipW-dependent-type signal peptide-containing protein [Microbacterium sp. M3]|uniref:SipW-dependent-type signal peptide-containing protein n=1 Tax=Microbacterium arthrosphaerae TaxID=792652 RepID=A0ABU4H782_9MICO|nr:MULTISPECIES: SipW-dependent-type signal peptide-containing protein [Microbacterium]MDW4573739.1 SipW-dependent-type signal peptide-containing protein [Microbacterium arthrosphaerae]MDW7607594.1 SipW-dependent-type signal peptide-containing protein [Microbacterium sp. M3]